MASDETMTVISSVQDFEFDETDDGYYAHHHQPHSLSRLSVCTDSMYTNDDGGVDDEGMGMFMSRLSIENFDCDHDADEELSLSGEKEGFKGLPPEFSSDSDKEPGTCYSLPATPPSRSRARLGQAMNEMMGAKDYASENEAAAQRGSALRRTRRVSNNSKRERVISSNKKDTDNDGSLSGESDQSRGHGSGVVVVTRPKGGRRSLCMGLEEMKACKDLGFEMEHERTTTLDTMPSRVSLSASTLDTNTSNSSGGSSPIANWRISSPGDDPRDVKARLKVWAQAVALASSTSGHAT